MPSIGIQSNSIASPFYDPYTSEDPPSEKVAKRVIPHEKDTIAAAVPNPAAQETSSCPSLEAPKQEVKQLRDYIECVKACQASRQTDTELSLQIVTKKQKANKTIKEEYFNQIDEKMKHSKISAILGWVNVVFTGVMGAAAVASIALALTTSVGTALPIALAGMSALAAVGAGVTTIIKGVLDHKTRQLTGEIEEKKSTRQMNNQKIKGAWEEMKQSSEVVFELWKQLSQVMKNLLSAALNMTK